jgi:hypothetical protein
MTRTTWSAISGLPWSRATRAEVALEVPIGEAVRSRVGRVDVEPGRRGGVGALLQHLPEAREVAPDVVEDAVEQHPDTARVPGRDEVDEVLLGAESPVDLEVVDGVVAVSLRLEDRAEGQAVAAQREEVVEPVLQPAQPRYRPDARGRLCQRPGSRRPPCSPCR